MGFFAGISLYIIIIAVAVSTAEIYAGDAQRLVLRVNELKKTGAHSVRERTRGRNTLIPKYAVMIMFIQTYTPTGLEVYVL